MALLSRSRVDKLCNVGLQEPPPYLFMISLAKRPEPRDTGNFKQMDKLGRAWRLKSGRKHRHVHGSFAWAIQLNHHHGLPGAEDQLAG